jgi:hypothetical protein
LHSSVATPGRDVRIAPRSPRAPRASSRKKTPWRGGAEAEAQNRVLSSTLSFFFCSSR